MVLIRDKNSKKIGEIPSERQQQPAMTWQDIVAEKVRLRKEKLEFGRTICQRGASSTGDAITSPSDDIASLTTKMAEGSVTAETVVLSYIERTLQAHSNTNCISEPLFEDAIRQAKALDSYFLETGKLIGPLHGVPMSVKDQFNVQGTDSTLGYVGRSFKPAERDAAMVALLKRLGAVIITKTALPQSILWGETESPLWGLTTFPNHPSLTPGGSSGGEAALLALSGSVCGWGTDIGGSIRGPSHICGLFGLKPSSSRLPYAGVPVSHEGQYHVPSSLGPMSRQLSTIVTVTREFINAEPWVLDPNVTPIPWREEAFQAAQSKRLKIGLILDDGIVRPHPEIELAVQRVADLFEQAGHEVVPWNTSDHMDCIEIMDQFYRADGGEDIRIDVGAAGEPLLPHVATLLESANSISVYKYWQLNRLKVAAQQAYNDKWNASTGLGQACMDEDSRPVDVLISPVQPHTAVPHRKTTKWAGYTKIWNFLDYTAMSFPFGRFSSGPGMAKDDVGKSSELPIGAWPVRQEYKTNYTPRNALDEWNCQSYDPLMMDGFPIGVQIIGRRFEEEKVLGVATVLEKLSCSSCQSHDASGICCSIKTGCRKYEVEGNQTRRTLG